MTFTSLTRAPGCLSCLRRLANGDSSYLSNPLRIQIRGKKRLPKSETITVRLLTDVPSYGRKGTIIAVAPARMRNIWYPNKNARYMTLAEIKDAKQQDLVRERDPFFGADPSKKGLRKKEAPQPDISIALLSPERSAQILESLIPETLDFFRRPIVASSGGDPEAPKNAIFGSVSTSDILASIKALLAMKATEEGNEDAAKVVLDVEDIRILHNEAAGSEIESDRIKTLGDFAIELYPRESNAISRMIRVQKEQN